MENRRFAYLMCCLLAIFAVVAVFAPSARAASTTTVIYSFAGDEDGEYTDSDLIMDSAGNLYGTSVLGGDFGSGTVFELSPSGNSWTHTVLYSFTGGADGGEPYKPRGISTAQLSSAGRAALAWSLDAVLFIS